MWIKVWITTHTRQPRARARTKKPAPTARPLSRPPTGQTNRPTGGRGNPAGDGEEPRNAAEREYRGGTERRDEAATRAADAQRERRETQRPNQARDERETPTQPNCEQGRAAHLEGTRSASSQPAKVTKNRRNSSAQPTEVTTPATRQERQ